MYGQMSSNEQLNKNVLISRNEETDKEVATRLEMRPLYTYIYTISA